MLKQDESPLKLKTAAFSDRISQLYGYLRNVKHEEVMSKQIYRSGTSVGANVIESRFAQSGVDFVSKLSIALKEAGETEYWLERLYHAGVIDRRGYESLLADITEIIKMLVSFIKTMKNRMGKK